jgi:hypothetical protein
MSLSGDKLSIWSGFIDDGVVCSMFLLNIAYCCFCRQIMTNKIIVCRYLNITGLWLSEMI